MNKTGTYAVIDGKVQKISDDVPVLERFVSFNKGGVPYFDRTLRRRFDSKTELRTYLKQHKLRDGGIINPDKRID